MPTADRRLATCDTKYESRNNLTINISHSVENSFLPYAAKTFT